MDKIFNKPFAVNGARVAIPENGTENERVSFDKGFTQPYEVEAPSVDNPNGQGFNILRPEMNEALYQLSNACNILAENIDKWTQLTTENLNDIKQAGRYYQNSNTQATNERNYPVNSAGYLIVLNTGINNYGVTQIYKVWNNDKIFIRRTTSSNAWSSWDSLTLTTELNSAVTQLQNAINTKEDKTKYSVTDLRNTDLNSVVARGYYQLMYKANNTNIPFTEAGFLFVYNYGENTVKQIVIGVNNPDNAIYTRFLHNGVWSVWNRFITNTEADTTYRKIADSYTKTQCDSTFLTIANANSTFRKIADSYTKTEVNNLLNQKSGLGVGQTWQDMKSSRAFNTEYTNNTGKPIQLAIGLTGNTGGAVLKVNNIVVGERHDYQGHFFAIIPNGSKYKLEKSGGSAAIYNWAELR